MSLFTIVAVLLAVTGTCFADSSSCPACNKYLLNDVQDSQLTESRHYCQVLPSYCTRYGGTLENTSAKDARLNATGFIDGAWIAPDNSNATDYVQVDFICPKFITAIALKGRYPAPASVGTVQQWVTKYKVKISDDCTTFNYVTDGNATPKIFQGSTSANDVVVSNLPGPVAARCVRIVPVEWYGHKTLRFDVIGCNSFSA